MENEKTNKKVLSLGKDLTLSPSMALFGYIMGYAGALINPLAIPDGIRDIRKNGINNVNEFVYIAVGTVAYTDGVYNIVKDIMDDPSRLEKYFPVMTNILGLIGWGALKIYQRGKEKGKLESRVK